jgi:anthranilate synthase component 1
LVGYVSYEAIKYWEKISIKHNKYFPLMEFGLYTDGIIYDHQHNKLEYFYYKKSRLKEIQKNLDNNQNKDNKISQFSISKISRNTEKKRI